MNISNQARASFAKGLEPLRILSKEMSNLAQSFSEVHANIDHGSARLDEVSCHETGSAHRRDQDIGLRAHLGQIASSGVTDGNRAVLS